MSQIVEVLKRDNPMVKDFVMACEQWSEEGVQDGRLILSAKGGTISRLDFFSMPD